MSHETPNFSSEYNTSPKVTEETIEAVGAAALAGSFHPEVEAAGSVEENTLGSTGWQRDGDRYERGDGK
jgi:hypothetical protein